MHPVLRLDHRYHDLEDHDRGLVFDMATLDRRRMLKLLGLGGISAGLFTIVGCNPSAASPAASAGATASPGASTGAVASADASCEVIPEETAGPFPGDGSNGPDVLPQSGVVRQDIRVELRLVVRPWPQACRSRSASRSRTARDCAPLAGAAVYVWHCDRDGRYSLYSQARPNENYLRGVQAAGADGSSRSRASSRPPTRAAGRTSTSRSIRASQTATDAADKIATSQIALPRTPATWSTRPPATSRASRT